MMRQPRVGDPASNDPPRCSEKRSVAGAKRSVGPVPDGKERDLPMKLLKAFVRADYIGKVVHALQYAQAPGITVSVVRGVGYDFVPLPTEPRVFPLAEDALSRCPEVAKVEVVCRDEDIDRLVAAVLDGGQTGGPGDGIVFVTPVERVVKVRTGEEGAQVVSIP